MNAHKTVLPHIKFDLIQAAYGGITPPGFLRLAKLPGPAGHLVIPEDLVDVLDIDLAQTELPDWNHPIWETRVKVSAVLPELNLPWTAQMTLLELLFLKSKAVETTRDSLRAPLLLTLKSGATGAYIDVRKAELFQEGAIRKRTIAQVVEYVLNTTATSRRFVAGNSTTYQFVTDGDKVSTVIPVAKKPEVVDSIALGADAWQEFWVSVSHRLPNATAIPTSFPAILDFRTPVFRAPKVDFFRRVAGAQTETLVTKESLLLISQVEMATLSYDQYIALILALQSKVALPEDMQTFVHFTLPYMAGIEVNSWMRVREFKSLVSRVTSADWEVADLQMIPYLAKETPSRLAALKIFGCAKSLRTFLYSFAQSVQELCPGGNVNETDFAFVVDHLHNTVAITKNGKPVSVRKPNGQTHRAELHLYRSQPNAVMMSMLEGKIPEMWIQHWRRFVDSKDEVSDPISVETDVIEEAVTA